MAIFDLSQTFFVCQRVVETSKIMGISSENHGWKIPVMEVLKGNTNYKWDRLPRLIIGQ
jgi:hypothetical protein